jgi:hypothetical protein
MGMISSDDCPSGEFTKMVAFSPGFYNLGIFNFINSRRLVKDNEYIPVLKAASYYRFIIF